MTALKTPIVVHRQVAATLNKIKVEQKAVDGKLESLLKSHGPGTPDAYEPAVLKSKHTEILSLHTNRVVGDYNASNDAVRDLQKNVAHFSRSAVMSRAELPVPQHRNTAATPQEATSTVSALRSVEAELIHTRLVTAIGKASDEQLVERLAPAAVRDNHQRMAGEISAEAVRRGGVLPIKVGNVLEALSIPEADEHADHLERLDQTHRDMKSAFNSLSTGNADIRARMHAATADYTGKPVKTFTGAL